MIILNTVEGWAELHNDTQLFSYESSLLLVSLSSGEIVPTAAAVWQAFHSLRNGETGEPRYWNTAMLFPRGKQAVKLLSSIIEEISSSMKADGVDDLMVRLLPILLDARFCISLDAASLIESAKLLAPESACIVLHPELYRFPESIPPEKHLERLLKELAIVAAANKLALVCLCDSARIDTRSISEPDDVYYLAMRATHQDDTSPEETAVWVEKFREGKWAALTAHLGDEFVPDIQIAIRLFSAFGAEKNLAPRCLEWEVEKQNVGGRF